MLLELYSEDQNPNMLDSLSELRHLPRHERSRVWKRAYLRSLADPRTWLFMVSWLLAAKCGAWLGGSIGEDLCLGIGAGFYTHLSGRFARPYIADEIERLQR